MWRIWHVPGTYERIDAYDRVNVAPAQAGAQFARVSAALEKLGSRLRGNDGLVMRTQCGGQHVTAPLLAGCAIAANLASTPRV